jgi:hypothetical protein
MVLTRKDVVATALTILVVLTFLATHEGWNVPLVGDSRRWAAAVVFALGALTCAQGSPGRGRDRATKYLAALGAAAVILAAAAIATASLTLLSLLVVDVVVLWLGATLRHVSHHTRRPIAV